MREMAQGPRLQRVMPLIQVRDMQESLAYYQVVLGFGLDFVWPEGSADPGGPAPRWAQVSRGEISFSLTIDLGTSSGQFIAEKGNGVVFYITVDDIDALYKELQGGEAIVVQELFDFGGRKQFSVADCNGYVIAFTEEFQTRR